VINNKARSIAASTPDASRATVHRIAYNAAMTSGIHTAMLMGAGAAITALAVAIVTIRVRREDLPDTPMPA
jgi:hypothetical protein